MAPSWPPTASRARARGARGSRVGRLELHFTHLLHSRSGGCRPRDLRVRRTSSDRSCPPLSAVCHSAADPARTKGVGYTAAGDPMLRGGWACLPRLLGEYRDRWVASRKLVSQLSAVDAPYATCSSFPVEVE